MGISIDFGTFLYLVFKAFNVAKKIELIGSDLEPTTRIVTHPLDVEKVFFSNCCSSLSLKIFNVCFCV